MLLVQDVRKTYPNQTRAIEHVSFSLCAGDLAVLLGREGAGKTTLLHCMAGILPFEGGDMRYDKHALKEEPFLYKQEIAFLPQEKPLYPFLTGQEYGLFVAAANGIAPREAKVRLKQELQAFGAEELLKKKIDEFTPEECRTLQLAVGFLKDPTVFLLEDPFSSLSLPVMQTLVDKLRKMSEQGGIVLFSDETLGIARALCNRAILLEQGKLAFEGSMEDLLQSGRDLRAYRENIEDEE